VNVGKQAKSKCCCLHGPQGGEDKERLPHAAGHMWHFNNLDSVNQHRLVAQCFFLKDQMDKKRPHQLPVWGHENKPPKNALTRRLVQFVKMPFNQHSTLEKRFWTSTEAAKTNVDPADWREGRKGDALKPETDADDLHV
jgi:hypothetical protein